MKKSIPFLGALVLVLNLMTLSFTLSAQETVGGGGTICKWYQLDCGDGKSFEGCLSDGDGNTCTCGTVTRPC